MKPTPLQLKRLSEGKVALSLLDIAVLLWHLYASSRDETIGYNDANVSMIAILKALNPRRKKLLSIRTLESALYCCNILDEQGRFWHPKGGSFDDFVKRIMVENADERSFNKTYNYFEEGKGKRGKARR